MFLDDVVGPMSVKEAKRLSGADKFRKHISDIEKKYEPSEKHYNRLKSDPAYREKEFQKWQQEVHGDKAVKEDSWHAGDGGTWGQGDAWSSEQHEMVEGRLHVGDPIVVTAPNEFEGKTGEIAEFSPSGKFAIVDLYNYGRHSMHLSDVEYNQYADREDEGVEEGFQDFNKVEPYEVCLAGKPVKTFDYYEDARRFHDNWKKKLYNQGEKEKADKITLNPIIKEMDKSQKGAAGWNIDDYDYSKGKWTQGKPTTRKKVVKDLTKVLNKAFDKEKEVKEDHGSWIVYDPETKQIKKRFKTHTAGKSYAKAHGLGFASSEYYFDNIKEPSVAEAETDYQKRRQRERDVDAGKPVSRQPKNPQTDYAKKRAQDKKDTLFGEAEGTPEGLPHLTKELLTHIVDQVGTEGAHAIIKSLEWGDGAAEELLALILKDLKADISDEEIAEHIGKVKGGYRLYSHKGKNLGTFPSKAGAEKHEREVQYFKHAGESVEEAGSPAQQAAIAIAKKKEQGIDEVKQRLDAKCWKGKHKEGTKIKGGVRVNNCVPNESVEENKKRALYYKTQDAPTKQAIDKAYRANPSAKNDTEALASLLSREIDSIEQQKELNQDQEQRIQDLDTVVSKIGGQAPTAAPTVTAPSMPSSIPTPMPTAKPAAMPPSTAGNVTPMPSATAPTPAMPAMPAAGAQQTAKQPKTATSPAIGQMAKQLSQPQGPVIKGKTQPSTDTTKMPNNVTQLPAGPEALKRLQQLGTLGAPTVAANNEPFKLVAEAVSPAELEQISTYNNQTFTQAYAHSQPAKMYYGDGQWEDLTAEEVERIVSAIATDYTPQTRTQVWQGLFTDHNYFNEFKKQHLSQQPLPFNEGDVVPFTNNQQTLQAYNDAMQIIKAVADTRIPDARVNTMRQTFASKYQQRYQIAQAPDRTYYLLDKQTNQRQRLPDPRTFAIENTDYWAKLQNERSKKLNRLVSELKESIK